VGAAFGYSQSGYLQSIWVREAELFKEAVRVNAPALIVSHVHPSGDPSPSPEDIQVTKQLVSAAKVLGIEFLDHLIIGKDTWVSLKERGLGF
jgi:DNA repair protein RadC